MHTRAALEVEQWDAIDLTSRAADVERVSAAVDAANAQLAQARDHGRDHIEYIAMLKRNPLRRADAIMLAELFAGAGWFVAITPHPVTLFLGGQAFKVWICRKRPSWFAGIRWEMKLEKCSFVAPKEAQPERGSPVFA